MRIKIRIDKLLLMVILYGCFFSQVYSYIGRDITLVSNSFVYEQLPRSNSVTMSVSLLVLLSVILLFFVKLKDVQYVGAYLWSIVVLIVAVIIWTIITLEDISMINLLYASAPPFLYLAVLFFVVGADEDCFQSFLKHARIIGVCSFILCVYYFFSFRELLGLDARLGNSAYRTYNSQAFWLLLISGFCDKRMSSKYGLTMLLILSFAIMNVVNGSRSWIIQCILWAMAYMYFSRDKKGVLKFFKSLVYVGVLVFVVYQIMIINYPQLLENLLEKLSNDTRSQQYVDLFAQTEFKDFLMGQGYFFTYNSQTQHGIYSYIDNAFLLLLIRYGVWIGIPYILSIGYPFLRFTSKRGVCKEIVPLLLWVLALGGLSTYCMVIMDLKTLSMAAVGGRCLYLSSMKKQMPNDMRLAGADR